MRSFVLSSPVIFGGALALVVELMSVRPAQAHELVVQCELRDERITVKVVYDDGKPAREANVRILDGEEQVVALGVTDHQGKWSIQRPSAGRYRVDVDAGAGHFKSERMMVPGNVAAARGPVKISDGPSYEEAVRTFWPKLVVGLGAIGGFFLALWFARRRKSTRAGPPTGADATSAVTANPLEKSPKQFPAGKMGK